MGRLQTEIATTKHDMELVQRDVSVLYTDLGRRMDEMRDYLPEGVCKKEAEALAEEHGKIEAIEEKMSKIRIYRRRIDETGARKNEAASRKAAALERQAVCFARIGAIAEELGAAGQLPETLVPIFSGEGQQVVSSQELMALENKAAEEGGLFSRISGVFAKRKLDGLYKRREAQLTELGRKIYEANLAAEVPGKNAAEAYENLVAVSSEIRTWDEKITVANSEIEEARIRMADEGTPENQSERLLDGLLSQKSREEDVLRRLQNEFGRALSAVRQLWLSDILPADIRETARRIDSLERSLEENAKKITALEKEVKIQELNSLIEQDSERINHLHSQISLYQRQIRDIQEKIAQTRDRIDQIRNS